MGKLNIILHLFKLYQELIKFGQRGLLRIFHRSGFVFYLKMDSSDVTDSSMDEMPDTKRRKSSIGNSSDVDSMKVADLKEALRSRGLEVPKGPKAVLRERLLEALAEEQDEEEEEAEDDDDEEEEEGAEESGPTNVELPDDDTDDGVSDSANYERMAKTNGADSSDEVESDVPSMPQTPGRDLAPIADPSHNLLAVAEKMGEGVDFHPAASRSAASDTFGGVVPLGGGGTRVEGTSQAEESNEWEEARKEREEKEAKERALAEKAFEEKERVEREESERQDQERRKREEKERLEREEEERRKREEKEMMQREEERRMELEREEKERRETERAEAERLEREEKARTEMERTEREEAEKKEREEVARRREAEAEAERMEKAKEERKRIEREQK